MLVCWSVVIGNQAGEEAEYGFCICDEAFLGGSAGAESEAAIVKPNDVDWSLRGGKAEKTLIGEWPV